MPHGFSPQYSSGQNVIWMANTFVPYPTTAAMMGMSAVSITATSLSNGGTTLALSSGSVEFAMCP